ADPEKVAKESRDPGLRLYSVPRTTSMTPLANVPHQQGQYTRWYEAGPDTVPGFSAVAYHFGKHLRQTRKVPIGLIHTSGGGTRAGSWTSRGALDAVPELRYYHEKLATAIKNFDPDKAKADYEKTLAEAKAAGKPAPRRPFPQPAPDKSPFSASTLYNAM